MKKLFLFLFVLVPMLCLGQAKIMVVADPHVLAQSLVQEGSAFDTMMEGQRKMIDLSESAFLAVIDTALLYKPDLVLIPGDLTKDSELASHRFVVAQLERLRAAGINVLVIPGNHDIGGDAYSYIGDQKIAVDNLKDEEWETMYDFVYQQAIAKDPNSHSYIAEPLKNLTVLAIDGAHDNAGTGSLSDSTLQWILTQADIANAQGKMLIAMCHWQLLEHVDEQETVMSSSQLANAEAIRDSLMAHDVHLVLTGHMHINSISTYRDTTGLTNDSIVEISTGSPITYPCPYRWLTISEDRSTVTVTTDKIMTLKAHADLQTYSRDWMANTVKAMIPEMSLRIWGKTDEALDMLRDYVEIGGDYIAGLLEESIPDSDSAKIDLVERHLGQSAVDLYLLHSDGNEPDHAESDSLAQAVYTGMENMLHEMTDEQFTFFEDIQAMLISVAVMMMKEPVQSLVEDRTHWASEFYSDRTDDLQIQLIINAPIDDQAIDYVHQEPLSDMYYDMLGRPVKHPTYKGVYIKNGTKVVY